MEFNLRTAVFFFYGIQLKLWIAITNPLHCSRIFVRFCQDFNLLSYHKGRVEAKSEVSNQISTFHFAFIFFHEFLCARESNLVNVFVNFLSSHTDTTVDDA